MLRATTVLREHQNGASQTARATAVLQHDERHLRRKVIALVGGGGVLVDLPEPVMLAAGDALLLEDGGIVAIAAADELLCEVHARNPAHLVELAWHIGNRHLPADITADRILIQRDHVIQQMLEGLGAKVRSVTGPFHPTRGAYASAGSHHDHAHGHDHERGHGHDEHGRSPHSGGAL